MYLSYKIESIIITDKDGAVISTILPDSITGANGYKCVVNYKKKEEDVISPHLVLNNLKDDSKFYYSMSG